MFYCIIRYILWNIGSSVGIFQFYKTSYALQIISLLHLWLGLNEMSFDLVKSNISLVKLQIRLLDECQLIWHQSKTQKYFVFIHYHIFIASRQLLCRNCLLLILVKWGTTAIKNTKTCTNGDLLNAKYDDSSRKYTNYILIAHPFQLVIRIN